jgi:hypothetical protein
VEYRSKQIGKALILQQEGVFQQPQGKTPFGAQIGGECLDVDLFDIDAVCVTLEFVLHPDKFLFGPLIYFHQVPAKFAEIGIIIGKMG